MEVVRHVDRASGPSTTAALAGARCGGGAAGACRCRVVGDDAETSPPTNGQKRFEIRLSADGGVISANVPGVGRFENTGPTMACFYVDLPASSTHEFSIQSRADNVNIGVAPRFHMVEYGPLGPFWYDVLAIECGGAHARCDRASADAWVERTVTLRKRGRLDPCGSAVVSKLKWHTSGGQHERDGGHYRDFAVSFSLEVKKFATQFAPGSTECVPK